MAASKITMRDEIKAVVLAREKCLYSLGCEDAITALPALCDGVSSCYMPPEGLTAALNAIAAIRPTTTIIMSVISREILGIESDSISRNISIFEGVVACWEFSLQIASDVLPMEFFDRFSTL